VAYDNNQGPRFDRPMFQGNWKCSSCGNEITELPFKPAEGRPVYCRDCYKKNRPPRRNF